MQIEKINSFCDINNMGRAFKGAVKHYSRKGYFFDVLFLNSFNVI
jgi:hypothetical protein